MVASMSSPLVRPSHEDALETASTSTDISPCLVHGGYALARYSASLECAVSSGTFAACAMTLPLLEPFAFTLKEQSRALWRNAWAKLRLVLDALRHRKLKSSPAIALRCRIPMTSLNPSLSRGPQQFVCKLCTSADRGGRDL